MKHTNTTNHKHIFVDMDNTLCALKNVPNVWQLLDNGDVTPYIVAQPIQHNIDVVKQYAHNGYDVHIVSWLSKITNVVHNGNVYKQCQGEQL